jgi:hypothetical protein
MNTENGTNQKKRKRTYTDAHRRAIYKWREAHYDQFREYERGISKVIYQKNAEKAKLYAKNKYWFEKEATRLRNICIEYYISII